MEVKDTGIGIPEDKIDAVFERFTQVEGHMSRRFGGTGLGLTIVKQIVELMQGTVGVRSRLGEGSTFWIDLPLPVAQGEIHLVAETGSLHAPASQAAAAPQRT